MYSSWPAACTTKLLFLQYASGKAPRLVRACALLADEVGNKHVRSELTVGAAVAAGSARLWAAGEVGLTPGGARRDSRVHRSRSSESIADTLPGSSTAASLKEEAKSADEVRVRSVVGREESPSAHLYRARPAVAIDWLRPRATTASPRQPDSPDAPAAKHASSDTAAEYAPLCNGPDTCAPSHADGSPMRARGGGGMPPLVAMRAVRPRRRRRRCRRRRRGGGGGGATAVRVGREGGGPRGSRARSGGGGDAAGSCPRKRLLGGPFWRCGAPPEGPSGAARGPQPRAWSSRAPGGPAHGPLAPVFGTRVRRPVRSRPRAALPWNSAGGRRDGDSLGLSLARPTPFGGCGAPLRPPPGGVAGAGRVWVRGTYGLQVVLGLHVPLESTLLPAHATLGSEGVPVRVGVTGSPRGGQARHPRKPWPGPMGTATVESSIRILVPHWPHEKIYGSGFTWLAPAAPSPAGGNRHPP
eukprot:scaffold1146_cov399-Prasinococcus_capsulatus_cf.AAC.54